jgi:hypothetical protein
MSLALKKTRKLGITIAAIIFGIGGLLHLIRLFANFSVVIAGQEVPLYFSVLAVVAAWFMAYWLWLSRD